MDANKTKELCDYAQNVIKDAFQSKDPEFIEIFKLSLSKACENKDETMFRTLSTLMIGSLDYGEIAEMLGDKLIQDCTRYVVELNELHKDDCNNEFTVDISKTKSIVANAPTYNVN